MKTLMIAPLFDLLDIPGRDYIKLGDFNQVAQKLRRQLRQKLKNPTQRHSAYIERRYLALLQLITKDLRPQTKFPKTALVEKIDTWLRAHGYAYDMEQRANVYNNHFINKARRQEDPELETYDLAFFNAAAAHPESWHYKNAAGLHEAFFIRCEHYPGTDDILIGNLQIDAPQTHQGPVSPKTKIMTNPKNMDLALAQQAIKHALTLGKTQIMFQTGDAAQIAQFSHRKVKEVRITAENLAEHEAEYNAELAHFDKRAVGEIIDVPGGNTSAFIYEKTTEYYKYAPLIRYFHQMFFPFTRGWGNFDDHYIDMLEIGNYEKFIKQYHEDFSHLAGTNTALPGLAEKVVWIKNKKTERGLGSYTNLIEAYSREFYFTSIKLARPDIKITPAKKGSKFNYYVDPQKNLSSTINKKDILRPVVGKNYITACDKATNLAPYRHLDRRYKLYMWYEKKLPALFKKLGLSCRRVVVATAHKTYDGEREFTSDVWLIEGDLKKFAERPLYCFSANTEVKSDIGTINELTAAARKFGISATQLKVLNATVAPEVPRTYYDRKKDEVTLGQASISLLAHEGLHRLRAKKLIPAKEYAALITAGKTLVRKNPQLQEQITSKNSAGQSRYPAGPVRQQEYAAIFIEHYYENNKTARAALLGKKINRIERVLRYVHALVNQVKAKLGNNAALAHQFLRRLEQNEINPVKKMNISANSYRKTAQFPGRARPLRLNLPPRGIQI